MNDLFDTTETSSPAKGQNVVYIGSGAKNGFYTLREAWGNGSGNAGREYHIINLSTDPDKAYEMAKAYFDKYYADKKEWSFVGVADFSLSEWGSGVSLQSQGYIKSIENGMWPFGKFSGQKFEEADDGYLLWWAQKTATKPIESAIIEKCKTIAEARKLFEAAKAQLAKEEADKKISKYIGEIGLRMKFVVKVVFFTSFNTRFGTSWLWNLVDKDGNKIVYFGSCCFDGAQRGDWVQFMARIDDYQEYKGEKQTQVKSLSKVEKIKE